MCENCKNEFWKGYKQHKAVNKGAYKRGYSKGLKDAIILLKRGCNVDGHIASKVIKQ